MGRPDPLHAPKQGAQHSPSSVLTHACVSPLWPRALPQHSLSEPRLPCLLVSTAEDRGTLLAQTQQGDVPPGEGRLKPTVAL